MGKQPRRRNRRNNKNSRKGKNDDTFQNSENTNLSPGKSEPHSLVTARIRHGDYRVRAGALSALSCTLFSPETLAKRKQNSLNNKPRKRDNDISLHLLKAISEKVLDDDGAVAKNAAGCWNNFILFGGSDGDLKLMKDIDIGTILTTRIQNCCTKMMTVMEKVHLYSQESKGTSEAHQPANSNSLSDSIMSKKEISKKNENKKKKNDQNSKQHVSAIASQFDIATICLQSLCALIENVPEAADTFTSKLVDTNPSVIGLPSSLEGSLPITHVIMQVLLLGTRALTFPSISTPLQSFSQSLELVAACMTWASRALHAILDENFPLAEWFLSHTASDTKPECNSLIILSKIVQGGVFSSNTRLHSCGTLITLRNISSSQYIRTETHTNAPSTLLNDLTKVCIEVVLPLLLQYLEYHPNIATALAQRVADAHDALVKEKYDEEIEKNIIKQVNKKKESARGIAKRQKEEKKAKKIAADKEKENKNDVDMEKKKTSDNVPSKSNEEKESSTNKRQNAQDNYDKAVKSWENAASPLKLALEVATNFCSVNHDEDAHLSKVDDMMMSDSNEEEEELMKQDKLAENNKTLPLNPIDVPILDAMMKANLPERVVTLLVSVSTTMQIIRNEKSIPTPELVQSDISQIISKCGSCLGNIGSSLPKKNADFQLAYMKIWDSLRNAISSSSLLSLKHHDVLLVTAEMTNAMTSLLRSNSQDTSISAVTEMKFLLDLLQHYGTNASTGSQFINNSDIDIDLLKDGILQNCIFMLGTLSTTCIANRKHDSESVRITEELSINCTNILLKANTTVLVQNEILNVFMDIFGQDEIAELNNLFESLDMMKVFKQSIPLFKSNMAKSMKMKKYSDKDFFQWKETALNSRRFIDYKKDQMEM